MLLRTRVTIIVSITYALMVAGLTFAGLKSEQLADQRYAEATLNGQELFWAKLVENTLQRMQTEKAAFAGHPDLIKAVADRNPAAVRLAMEPVAAALARNHHVARYEVVSPDGDLLYSSTGSLLDPPLLDAGTVRLIADTGKAYDGIVEGADHWFTAAVSLPLADASGQVVGVATVAGDLHPPLAEFKASTGSDIFILDRGGRVTTGTDPGLARRLFHGPLSVRKSRMETWKRGGRYYALVVLPLRDGEERVIGALATARDVTATQQRQAFIRRAALGSVGTFFALVLFGFYVYLRRSFRPLDEAIRVLNALSNGDTSVRLEVANHKDEIGRIAGTVGVFRDNAVKIEMLEQRRERQRRRQELFIRLQMQGLSEMLEAEARAAVLADLAEIEAIAHRGGRAAGGADRGEIEVLAKAFQTMSNRIREQHTHLESLIAERTRDVEILQEALRTRDQLAVLRQELDFARELQLSSLPQVFPPFPERDEFLIHAAMVPAKEVGGDFYDFFLIDRNHLGFVIGDASGKGVPAAMFIAITRSLVKAVAPLSASPSECLAFVNTMLSADNPQLLFATTFYAVLDLRSGEVAFCNAGHPPPMVLRADGRVDAIRDVSGVALGVMEDLDYDTGTFHLAPGDAVLLYTDGVTEATDAAEALFEEARLMDMVGALAGQEPSEVIARVQEAVEGFVGEAPQFDDITMLALRFDHPAEANDASEPEVRRLMLTGFARSEAPPPAAEAAPAADPASEAEPAPAPEAEPAPEAAPAPEAEPEPAPALAEAEVNAALAALLAPPVVRLVPVRRPPMAAPSATGPSLEVTIANDLDELQRLAGLVNDFVAGHGLAERMAFNLNLCLDELITNIVSYGYDDGGRHEIRLRFAIEGGSLVTVIADDAKAYDPFSEAPEPDLDAGVDERRIGGLGVFLVKEFNDVYEYRREGDKNVVTLKKAIEKEAQNGN